MFNSHVQLPKGIKYIYMIVVGLMLNVWWAPNTLLSSSINPPNCMLAIITNPC